MVSLCNIRLLHPLLLLLLLITATVLVTCSATPRWRKYRPAWSRYADAMYSVCISKEAATVRSKLITLRNCFNVERKFIQCLTSNRPDDSRLVVPSTFPSVLQAPCGSVHLLNKIGAPFATRQWRITVLSQFYLNLTFLELVLPMPYNRCNHYQGSGHLQIRHQKHTTLKDGVFLCGEHSPFSVVWKDSQARLIYRRAPSITQIGHFHIQYQVCSQWVRTLEVATIHQSSVLQGVEFLWSQLGNLHPFESGPRHMIYSAHLLGNRLMLLDMMFVLQKTDRKHFNIDAFDGPGPAELHRHQIEQQILDVKWVHFLTFQAYLQITCERYHCSSIFIKYRWPSGLRNVHNLMAPTVMREKDLARLCSKGSYWHCVFQVEYTHP